MTQLTKVQKGFYIAAGIFFLLGIFFEFCMIGYLMSALVCWALALWLALYAMLSRRNTAMTRRLRLALVLFVTVGFPFFLAAEIPVLLDARSDSDTSAPWLIVCGAGVNGSVPSRSMTDRLAEAMDWLEANPDGTAILSGCQGPGEDLSEAQAMYDYLTEKGVDPTRLLREDKARNSRENIENSLDIIAARGGDPTGRVAILSSEYHLHRLGYMGKKLGCQPVLVAARTTRFSLFVNYAIREAFAMWKVWVFGI